MSCRIVVSIVFCGLFLALNIQASGFDAGRGTSVEPSRIDPSIKVSPIRPKLTSPMFRIALNREILWGQTADVPVYLDSANSMINSFDLLIAYDRYSLRLKDVILGPELLDTARCGWEYFSYRQDTACYPDSLHPIGLVRLSAIADTHNGGNHPRYGLPGSLPATIATLQFGLSNDRNLQCWFFPINFVWFSCFDNSVSEKSPRRILISRRVLDTAGAEIAGSASLPSYTGAPDSCLGQHQDGATVSRAATFQNGGVHVVCPFIIDVRGDINLNGLAFEMADYIMYRNYFLEGLTAFGIHANGSMAASDINGDGFTLDVADLMQLYRIVIGLDAPPTPPAKHSPNETHIRYDPTTGNVLILTPDTLGAVWLIFNGMPPDTIIGPGKILSWTSSEGQIKVLLAPTATSGLYPMARGVDLQIQPPPSSLRVAEVSTIDAGTVNTVIDAPTSVDSREGDMPTDFALYQNYPNPFNLSTTICFDLPRAGQVKLEIINLLGEVVFACDELYPAGYHSVSWDGTGRNGRTVSSGVYYARVTAGELSAARKMVLLK